MRLGQVYEETVVAVVREAGLAARFAPQRSPFTWLAAQVEEMCDCSSGRWMKRRPELSSQLQQLLHRIPRRRVLCLGGDFNTALQSGRDARASDVIHPRTLIKDRAHDSAPRCGPQRIVHHRLPVHEEGSM